MSNTLRAMSTMMILDAWICVNVSLNIEFERVLLLFYMNVIREIREVCKKLWEVRRKFLFFKSPSFGQSKIGLFIENRSRLALSRGAGCAWGRTLCVWAHVLSAHAGPQIRFLSDFLNIFAVFWPFWFYFFPISRDHLPKFRWPSWGRTGRDFWDFENSFLNSVIP